MMGRSSRRTALAAVVAAGGSLILTAAGLSGAEGAPTQAGVGRVAELGLDRSCWTHAVPYRDQDGRAWLEGDAPCSDRYGEEGRFAHVVRTKGGLVVNLTYFANQARAATLPPAEVTLIQRVTGSPAPLPVARVVVELAEWAR